MARKKADDAEKRTSPRRYRAAFAREKIAVTNAREVGEYLDAHADLAAVVPAICAQARQEFGKDAELILQVYRDPEINDHYLELEVRLPSYDDTAIARLDSVTDPFDAELCERVRLLSGNYQFALTADEETCRLTGRPIFARLAPPTTSFQE